MPIVGTFVMIVLGAMLIGTEYGYDTWKNLLIRRAGRVTIQPGETNTPKISEI